jgi:photosystem II stability/assembly factor-like uncharacterized protein
MSPGFGIAALVVDPRNSGTVYAATMSAGLFKSTDAAESWKPVNSGLPVTSSGTYIAIWTLAIDPHNTGTVYAAAHDAGGVFKSIDGGASWSAVNSGITTLNVQTLAVDPHNPNTVYAGTVGGGVFAINFGPEP